LKKVKPRQVRTEITLDSKALDRCVGRYHLSGKFFFNVRRAEDHLQAQLTGQSYLELYPASPTEFFYEDIKAEISFATNAAGGITSLTLHQNDIDQTAKKISDEIPKEPVAVKLPEAALDACTGKFKLQPGVFFNLRRSEDRLEVQLTGQPYIAIYPTSETEFFCKVVDAQISFKNIYPTSETEFFCKVVDAQISFKKNPRGEIDALVLHQNGIDQTAERVKD
jgi:hypothetical protein